MTTTTRLPPTRTLAIAPPQVAPPASDRIAMVADGLLSVPDAAALLGLGKSTLYGLMDAGRLSYVKIGKSRRIPKRALFELAAASVVTGPVGGTPA